MVESVKERKDRIARIREDNEKSSGNNEATVRLRNYIPYDASLATPEACAVLRGQDKGNEETEHTSKRLKVTDGGTIKASKAGSTGADLIRLELQRATSTSIGDGDGPEARIVSQKIDHDLKLQLSGKMSKLQKRTRKAIVDMLREKLQAEE